MDNNQPDITIIVPVYNVEAYLRRCLDSLICQSLKNIEILIVDDGSTDNSYAVAEEYASGDERICLIHQENQGLSGARNTGLRNARGRYILFVDSDDFIKPESCEMLLQEALRYNCDIVSADQICVYQSKLEDMTKHFTSLSFPCGGKKFLVEGLRQCNMSMCAPYGLYRRDFILENGLFFYPGIYHEDELWTPQAYLAAETVSHLEFCFYYHWFREDSIVNNPGLRARRSADQIFVCTELYKKLRDMDFEGKDYVLDSVCTLYLSALFVGSSTQGDRELLKALARGRKNRLKAGLYRLSPKLYLFINRSFKKLSPGGINHDS